MNNYKVIIVEDEPIIAADLSNQLRKADVDVLGIFEEGGDVLEFLKNETPQVILMDIQIYGDIDGIDLANHINQLYSIPIIFLTSNTDTATFNRAKLSFPHAFLSKPFRIKDVLHSIDLAVVNESEDDKELEFLKDRIFIRHKDSLEKVLFANILFIQADGAYTKIRTREKEYTLSQTMKKIEEKVSSDTLLRVHRSYIVNVHNIDRLTDGYVFIGTHKIPVSRTNRDELLRLFKTL